MAGGNNNNQDNTGGGVESNIIQFIFHGVNLGTIKSIGTVADYFPTTDPNLGAVNVPSVEQSELSTAVNPLSNGSHSEMMRKCLEFPGYKISTRIPGNYENAFAHPLDTFGGMNQQTWNQYNVFSNQFYEGSGVRLLWNMPAYNNSWNWSTYYQVLLNHNRYEGLPILLDNNSHKTRCAQIIKGTGASGAYKKLEPTTPIIETEIPFRDWKNISNSEGTITLYFN
jgi:hypothetical protein